MCTIKTTSARVLAVTSSLLLLTGCLTVGPDYKPPETAAPKNWSSDLASGLVAKPTDAQTLARWWTVFNDSTLSGLMEQARKGNLSVRKAEAALREARADRGIQRAALFPTASVNAAGSRTRSSKAAGGGGTANNFANGFDASWELDIFGGKRRSLESATATMESSEEDLRDTLVSLFAEVAVDYVEIRSYQMQLAIVESSVASQTETYEIVRWRHQSGLITQLDEDQARLSLEQTRAEIPTLRRNLEQTGHNLAILLGQQPGTLKTLLVSTNPIPVPPSEVAVGVPANALRQRPDVRSAERKLAAQTAQIGVAEADRYPTFTLNGSIGLESLMLGNLYTASARTAQLAANATWKFFDGGKIRENIKKQVALQEQVLCDYETAVLTALKDVENAMVAYANEHTRRRALAEAVRAGQSALDLARNQYFAGLVDFETVLTTQRSLLSAQRELVISDATISSDLISLYKALGGGWTSLSPSATNGGTKTSSPENKS